jgi:hypothetical protein
MSNLGDEPKVLDGLVPEVQHCCCTAFIGTV